MSIARRSLWLQLGVAVSSRWWWLPVLLTVMLSTPSPVPAQNGDSQDREGASAAIVVDDGKNDPVHVVVAYDDVDPSALDLLRMSNLPVVTVEFGGLGEGVCSIIETGCDVGACRRRLCQNGDPESPFWQLWLQGDDEAWSISTLGGSHSQVEDGDIMAWVWTGVEPDLPALEWDEVAGLAGAPDSVANQGYAGPNRVWTNARPMDSDDDGQPLAGTLVSIGILAALVAVGLLLIRRRARATGVTR